MATAGATAIERVRSLGAMADLALSCARAVTKPTRSRRREPIRQSAAILKSAPATVVAGVLGTMFTAELGARAVRGELDALAVLGVDPILRSW
jgi:Permease MlaE